MILIDHGQLDGTVEASVARLESVSHQYDREVHLDGALFDIRDKAEKLHQEVGCHKAACTEYNASVFDKADRWLDDIESALGLVEDLAS